MSDPLSTAYNHLVTTLRESPAVLDSVAASNIIDLATDSAGAKLKKPRLPTAEFPYLAVVPSPNGDEYNLTRSSCDAQLVQYFDIQVNTASWRITDTVLVSDILPIKWAVITALYPLHGFQLIDAFSDGTQWRCMYRLEAGRAQYDLGADELLNKHTEGWTSVMVVRAELSIPRDYLGAL